MTSAPENDSTPKNALPVDSGPTRLPRPAVGRLSLYFRELHRLADQGDTHVNSKELGALVDGFPSGRASRPKQSWNDWDARHRLRDRQLIAQIGDVLGSGVQWQVVLVGVGSLGDALLRYRGFQRLGFRLVAAFDSDTTKVGSSVGGVTISDAATMAGRLTELNPDLAILAVPADQATLVAADLVACGISGILTSPLSRYGSRGQLPLSTLILPANSNAWHSVFRTSSVARKN